MGLMVVQGEGRRALLLFDCVLYTRISNAWGRRSGLSA